MKERMVSENLDPARLNTHLFEICSILAFKASQDLESIRLWLKICTENEEKKEASYLSCIASRIFKIWRTDF